MPRNVTISACQYLVRPIRAFDDMASRVRGMLDQVKSESCCKFHLARLMTA